MLELTAMEALTIAVALGSPVGVYAAIKSDLAQTREKALNAQVSANNANLRIDTLLNRSNNNV